MTKIGIITLNGYHNFGNRLQNYALQQFLEQQNLEVTTIWKTTNKQFVKEKLKLLLPINKKNKRYKMFYNFSKKYIKTKKIYCDLKEITNDYDYFVVGSDQVWNYKFPNFNEDFFLNFSKKEKNIAYAASFGIKTIEEKYIDIFKKGLKNFKAISVRENHANDTIKSIDKSIISKTLLDPTLLIKKEQWEKIMKKPKEKLPKKYILCYFLGKIEDEIKDEIDLFSKKNKYEIINILDIDSKYYTNGPAEFLYLIKNADFIFTDSFHSTVFSIIFEKPFTVFKRDKKYGDMFSRLESLLQLLKLENHIYKQHIIKEATESNYDIAKEIIKEEQKKSLEFIQNNIKGN